MEETARKERSMRQQISLIGLALLLATYGATYAAGIVYLAHLSIVLAAAAVFMSLFGVALVLGMCRAAAPRTPFECAYDDASQMYYLKHARMMPANYRGYDALMPALAR
jgi:hypothetical protein